MSLMTTRSPSFSPLWLTRHLSFCWSSLRYSFLQRSQKCCRICSMSLYRSSLLGFSSRSPAEGRDVSGLPIRKCAGVKGHRSFGSEEKGVMGLELRIASTCVKRVDSSSNVKCLSPNILVKWYFALLTPASQMPPKCGKNLQKEKI